MSDLIPEEALYILRCGPEAYHEDPAILAGPDARGIVNRIKTLSKKIERDPLIGIKIWNKHEEALQDLPMVRSWWAYRHYHLTEADNELFDTWDD